MLVTVYLTVHPGSDRVHVQTNPPTSYQRVEGSFVYQVDVNLPNHCIIDDRIALNAIPFRPGLAKT